LAVVVSFCHGYGGLAKPLDEFRRFSRDGPGAPTENPVRDLIKAGQSQGQAHTAVGLIRHFLTGVPHAFPDQVGRGRVEVDDNSA